MVSMKIGNQSLKFMVDIGTEHSVVTHPTNTLGNNTVVTPKSYWKPNKKQFFKMQTCTQGSPPGEPWVPLHPWKPSASPRARPPTRSGTLPLPRNPPNGIALPSSWQCNSDMRASAGLGRQKANSEDFLQAFHQAWPKIMHHNNQPQAQKQLQYSKASTLARRRPRLSIK